MSSQMLIWCREISWSEVPSPLGSCQKFSANGTHGVYVQISVRYPHISILCSNPHISIKIVLSRAEYGILMFVGVNITLIPEVIVTVPAYSSAALSNVLPYWNAMLQTQDMTPTPSQYTDTGHDTPPRHSIKTQDMTPHPVTVYRHRTWHPTMSQYTDTGHDTPPRHSLQTQDMTPNPSQSTDTGHDTPPRLSILTQDTTLRHSLQTQEMTPRLSI